MTVPSPSIAGEHPMPASRTHTPGTPHTHAQTRTPLVSPVVDYEPPLVGMGVCRAAPALRRRAARPSGRVRRAGSQHVREADAPPDAVAFTDAALRRVLEVIDRRRPVAQLRPLLAPALIDTVIELSRTSDTRAARTKGMRTVAKLCRMRLRMVDGTEDAAAEVFGTYTSGPRVRAFAARIELSGDRWRIVALQIG
nr:Rv3235 family protein [Mycolicibacterium rhodesiae]